MKTLLSQNLDRMLSWSEQYTRTDMRYLAHGGFWLLVGQVVNFAGSLVLVWLFANLLSKETYGEFRFLIAMLAFLSLTSLPGMNIALTRAVAQGKAGTFFPVFRRKIIGGLIGSVVGIVLASYYYLVGGRLDLALAFLFISIVIPFFDTFALYPHYLRGKIDFRLEAQYRNIQKLFVVGCTASVLFLTSNVYTILAVYVLSTLLADACLLILTLRKHPLTGAADEHAMQYGTQLSFITAMRLSAQYLDKIVLWYFVGPAQVAMYVIAVAVPQEMTSAFARIQHLALPKMSVRGQDELRDSMLRKVAVFMLCVAPFTILYMVTAPTLFSIFFPQYTDAVFLSQLASLLFLSAPIGLLVQYFQATARTDSLFILNVVELTTLIGLYLVFVPLYGILGVLIATLLRHAVAGTVLFGLLQLEFREKSRRDTLR